ncbi:MAG: GTP-binding protein [Promethearchaeota archaeon]|nr:MAG: GTP-binding protein [Candidatus Lokiarchaeota archaeon]
MTEIDNEMTNQPKLFFKISLIGDIAVGKTSLIDRFVNGKFEQDYIATMGVNISLKNTLIGELPVQLMLWDIGGSEKWEKVRNMFYRGTSGALLIYDITRPATFLNITHYLLDLEKTIQKKVPFVLIGNKNDLEDLRKIEAENARKLVEASNGVTYYETSAKSGENVEEAFRLIAEECLKLVTKKLN